MKNYQKKVWKIFNLKNEKKENIIFTFKDEQGDIILLKNEEDIINNSKEINYEKLSIEINLEIFQRYEENKNNINNEIKKLKNKGSEENAKLAKIIEEQENEIKDLKNINFNLEKDFTKKINKVKFMLGNEFKDIIINYINNENIKNNIDIFRNNNSNINENNEKNNEKDILRKKISIIENQMQNILSLIKEINTKISKQDEDKIILKKKEDEMKTIALKERKNYEIMNNFQFEINQKNIDNDNKNAQNGKLKNKNKNAYKNESIINTHEGIILYIFFY